jgi:hypothetical protein
MNPTLDIRAVDRRIARKVERGAEKLGRFQAVQDWYGIQRGLLRIAYKGISTEQSIAFAACTTKETVN